MNELAQIIGALLVLVPFACQQLGSLRADSPAYLWLNLLGSGTLGVSALFGRQWGFLLVESCWALLTAWSIATAKRSPEEGVGA
jgi:hypothetical protein